MSERVLIFGSGAREHSLAYRLVRNNQRSVIVSPGNAGLATEFECIDVALKSSENYLTIAKKTKPDLVIIGSENALAMGVTDLLVQNDFAVFGPTRAAAELESSKNFMKSVCVQNNVATARYRTCSDLESVKQFLRETTKQLVVKADGLCAGKGVVVCQDHDEVLAVAHEFFGSNSHDAKFGEASKTIVIEEFLPGHEVSVFALCDGQDAVMLAPIRDHKRALEGDLGPNTGGMGTVGPTLDSMQCSKFLQHIREQFVQPILYHMSRVGTPFRGTMFLGLMVQQNTSSLLEINVRFGDPETQSLMFGTDADFYPYFLQIAQHQSIRDLPDDLWQKMMPTATVVLAAPGYPDKPQVGLPIEHPTILAGKVGSNSKIFFAGVGKNDDGSFVTSSGRVLCVTSRESSLENAIKACYQLIPQITFTNAHFRTDIGRSLIERN